MVGGTIEAEIYGERYRSPGGTVLSTIKTYLDGGQRNAWKRERIKQRARAGGIGTLLAGFVFNFSNIF